MKPYDKSLRSSRFDRVFVIGFLGLIWLPFVGLFVDLDPTPNVNENRRLASLPGTNGVRLSRTNLRAYFKDHIGFRNALVQTHGAIKLTAFRSATTSDVIVGKDGWLFNNLPLTVDAYTGELECNEESVGKWRSTLVQRGDYLAKKQIAYGIVLVPDKQFIYPEFLPDAIAQNSSGSYTERLIRQLHQPNVRVIELFAALRKAKPDGELFYCGDTHWNGRGIVAGYKAVLRQLGTILPALADDRLCNYEVVTNERVAGQNELYRLIGVESVEKEPRIHAKVVAPNAEPVTPPQAYLELEPDYAKKKNAIVAYSNPSPAVAGRKLVMFHTSFSIGPLRSLLAEHFERCVFVRHSRDHVLAFHKFIVESEHPSIVLNEIPTRYLTVDPTLAYRKSEWSDSESSDSESTTGVTYVAEALDQSRR